MPNTITPIHYLITDAGDGSARLRLFKTEAAKDLFLELDDCNAPDLSEGGSTLEQRDFDEALDEDAVRKSFT
jgi:hypothetical protein